MQIRTILYQYIKTLIKHVFLLNFTHELLMSFRTSYIEFQRIHKVLCWHRSVKTSIHANKIIVTHVMH